MGMWGAFVLTRRPGVLGCRCFTMKKETLDKLVARIDRMGKADVQSLLLRLAAEKGLFQEVFESLRDGLILFDEKGKAFFANRAAAKIFDKPVQYLLNLSFETLVGKTCTLAQLSESKLAISRDLQVNYPEERHYNFYMAPIGDPSSGYLVLIHDDTESQRRREENADAERFNAVAFLAAGVAHEIGNPLNSLGLHLQLISRKVKALGGKEREMLEPLLETAHAETKRLDTILKQFLQAVRPTEVQRSPVDLNEVIRQTLDVLAPEIAARGVEMRVQWNEQLPLVDGDATQLAQVFYNLIRNAYQSIANPAEGGVFIQTDFTDADLRVNVCDSGSGISHEVLGSIYEPFRTTKEKGNGLGLLIVRRIVKDHGGSMSIASSPGQGTTVTVLLPRADRVQRLLPNG